MSDLLHILHAIGIAGLFAAFCLGTGFAVTRWLKLSDSFLVPIGFGCTSLAGLVAFCAWWASPKFGAPLSLALGLGAVALVTSQSTAPETRRKFRASAPTLIATLLLLGTLLCLVHAGGVPAAKRFTWNLPIDNRLPQIFADRIASARYTGPITGDWLASDRPPLQAGVLLLFRPFLGQGQLAREAVETLCQVMWLPALAALGGALRFRCRDVAIALILCATSGFFLVNSAYTWPKLMATALFITAIAAVIELRHNATTATLGNAAAVGALLALSMLAHGGVAFSLLALPTLPLAWFAMRRFGLLGIAVLGLAFVAVSTPWSAYKRFVDPPGNQLIKMHLAGVSKPDARSSLEAISDAYSKANLGDITKARTSNVKLVTIVQMPDSGETWDEWVRRIQFFCLVPAIGLPLLGVIWLVARRWRDPTADAGELGLVLYSIATVAIWVALMFSPNSAVVHQGSYVPVALLIFIGSVTIARWPVALLIVVAAAHIALFLGAWVLGTPIFEGAQLNSVLMVASGVLFVGAAAMLFAAPRVGPGESGARG